VTAELVALTLQPPFASDAQVQALGRGLVERTLPRPEWTHFAHLSAAAWIIAGQSALNPERDMPDVIRAYNVSVGGENTDTAGYHHTITLASLAMVRRFLAERPTGEPLHQSVNALVTSELANKDWLLGYWSRPVLFSVEARRGWVEPDLQPLLA
jgi:hypothetical protein